MRTKCTDQVRVLQCRATIELIDCVNLHVCLYVYSGNAVLDMLTYVCTCMSRIENLFDIC